MKIVYRAQGYVRKVEKTDSYDKLKISRLCNLQ